MIVVEIQYTENTPAAVLTESYGERNTAEQAYHTKLASAAVSTVDIHSVIMLDDYGARMKGETYYHKEII